MIDYTKINSETWDSWAEDGCEWSLPISHEEYEKTTADNFTVYLTPCISVPHEWFGDLNGKKVLGLASGGGQQMPVFSKLGAECTVFDYSDRQLKAEKTVSEREGYSINIIKGDMSKALPFEDESFDIVFHPVSNNYVEDVYHVWNECCRVLKKGGRLLAGMDNGINYLFEENEPLKVVNSLPFNPLKMPKERLEKMIENGDGVQFSHTLDEQIGGQLKAGFLLKDLYEDRDREGGNEIGKYYPQYFATLAVKKGEIMRVSEKTILEIDDNSKFNSIEQLSPEDYNKCSNIWNMNSQPLADKWLEEIKNGNRIVYIYKIGNEFIGEGALVLDADDADYTIPDKRVYVSRMIVKKEYQNHGIGSEILTFLILKAKAMGFSEMTIGVDKDNENALHLYRKYGFTEVLFDGADKNGEYFKLMKRI